MSLAGVVNSHLIAAQLITRYGTEEQRERWLPQLATAERRGCFSLSEHDSGSDAGALQCKAARDGDEWVINGTKMWVTNGERAGLVALLARAGDEGITCFLVDKEPGASSGGITISHNVKKLGYRGLETVEMTYVDHRLPADRVLGGPGRGRPRVSTGAWRRSSSDGSTSQLVASAWPEPPSMPPSTTPPLGRRSESRSASTRGSSSSSQRWQPRWRRLDCSRGRLRARSTAGQRADMAAGMAKLFASETAAEVSLDAMRIHGGNGFTTEYPVERYYRDAPLMIIGEGTSEIQKMVIGRGLMRGDRP